jgi:hypothetical protein
VSAWTGRYLLVIVEPANGQDAIGYAS